MEYEKSYLTVGQRLYFYLLNCAIRGKQEEQKILEAYKEVDSQELVEIARGNGQMLLLYAYIIRFDNYKNQTNKGSDIPVPIIVREYQKYECIRKIIKKSEEEHIQLIFFKGCVLADLYPQYIQRVSCDTDILVSQAHKAEAQTMLEKLGYRWKEEASKAEVQVYVMEEKNHVVELHTCLWEDFKGKRLDLLDSMKLADEKSLIHINVCGMQLTTLGYEEHLIYQIFHIVKHMSLQGIGTKYMVDITLYINQYGQYIDYNDLWEKLTLLGYEKFSYEFFHLCVDILGMDDTIIKGCEIKVGHEINILLTDLLQRGIIHGDKNSEWQLLSILTPYLVGEKSTSHSGWKRKLQVAFPRLEHLPRDRYQYARNVPLLLPIAWIHRAIYNLLQYRKDKQHYYSLQEKLDVAENRIALMDSLGLTEEK